MKPTTKWITGAMVIAGIIYALSPGPAHLANNPDGWEFREQFIYLTGLSALSLMSLSMVISLRLPWFNKKMAGLDKAYIVHKWAGIVSTVLMIFHWLGEKIPRWLVQTGFITNPGELNDRSTFSDLEISLFQSGVLLVEWTFYIVLVLVVVALYKKIPYHIFRKTHKFFPGVFLVAAYHGATAQLKEHWLTTPGGYLLLILILIGVVAALVALFQQIGAAQKVIAVITKIEHHQQGITDIRVETPQKPLVYHAGQYAFLRFAHDSEPHPFTIASSGIDPHSLRFAVKSLGGFTNELQTKLWAGQSVEIEGPYGEFDFDKAVENPKGRQIWIAGGIGITPFIGRLEHLTHHGGTKQKIDFWYSTRSEINMIFPDSLPSLCQRTGVNFYHMNSAKQEYLTAQTLFEVTGNFDDVSIWFCGPAEFSECLLKDLSAYNFDKKNFHYDSFSMR
jgi:predicted ferric reductase